MKLTHRFSLRRKKVSEPCYCQSPLYKMSARDIAEHTFEIILTMEGITPETGNTVQVTQRYQCCGTFCNNLSSFIQNDRSKLLLNQKAAFMRVVMQDMENVKDVGFQKRWKGRITWGNLEFTSFA